MNPARIFVSASILVLLFLLVPFPSHAASPGEVVINEIMWMGSSVSTADEWLELRNTTDQDIDIGGWQLTKKKSDGSEDLMLTIPSEATVSANGHFLISNNSKDHVFNNGESVLNVEPDIVSSSVSLANTKLQIKLYDGPWDGGGNLIDTADDGIGAPAVGDNGIIKASMSRKNPSGDGAAPASWYTSTASVGFDSGATEKGTPGSENTDAPEEPTYSDQIFLNEIMPDPEGSDTEGEYMELYNASDEEVNLEGWKIGVGDSTPKTLGGDVKLSSYLVSAGGFLAIYRKDSHSVLNNSGGTVKLLNPNDEIVGEVIYPEVKEGWVYQRYPDGDSSWSESNEPTAGAANKPSSSVTSNTSNSSPQVTFSVEDDALKVNQSFDVKVQIKNAKSLHDYYVKVRLGLEESGLSKGRTYSSLSYDSWLADNASWSKFPVVHTAPDGTEGIIVSAKVAAGNPAGTYIIGVRIRDKETEKNYDSGTQTIVLGEEDSSEADSVASNDEDGGEGAVLGAMAELPATGGSAFNFGFLGLVLGLILKIEKLIDH